jgi:hypothetical protein
MQTSILRQNIKVKNADGKNIDGQNVEWDKRRTEKTLNGTEGQKTLPRKGKKTKGHNVISN